MKQKEFSKVLLLIVPATHKEVEQKGRQYKNLSHATGPNTYTKHNNHMLRIYDSLHLHYYFSHKP